jgi:hypothetical protein
MLCQRCHKVPVVYAVVPKLSRHQDTTPEPVGLCHDCLRTAKAVEGWVSSYRLITETADPQRWGVA